MSKAVFLRLLKDNEKEVALLDAVSNVKEGRFSSAIYEVEPEVFRQIPGAPFAYWSSDSLRSAFTKLPALDSSRRHVRFGASTKNDFRFLRAWWEVAPRLAARTRSATRQGRRWVPFEKGGSVAPYYRDWELVVDWANDGAGMKEDIANYRGVRGWGYDWSAALNGHSYYFRSGITWPRRADGLSFRVLPKGCIFGDKGPAIFVDSDDPTESLALCALLNSKASHALIAMQLGRVSLAQSYEVGLVQRTPVFHLDQETTSMLADLGARGVALTRSLTVTDEVDHLFSVPSVVTSKSSSLRSSTDARQASIAEAKRQREDVQARVDELCFANYRIQPGDLQFDDNSVPNLSGDEVADEEIDVESEEAIPADPIRLISDFISYAVGCVCGRWDIRLATNEREAPPLPDPFAPLPVCSPGMLTGDDGLPAQEAPPGYPLAITWDGILVDDPGHPQDVIGRIREVLGVIWGERADAIYEEATQILAGGGGDLRPWFRATFFDEHIKRYSKSRRKAPIYWRLATPSNSYALWLYYHRFDRDTLYKALNDYVAPKVQYEERQLATLQGEAGGNPTASQRRAIGDQEDFVEELRAFRDELARVAPLWNPDLNDGVIINFAPLWRLTPRPRGWQKECRDTWTRLARGDYDWAHLAMHLWPERVVPKCRTDRSLAIAHGLDDQFWIAGDDGKWRARHVSDATLEAIIAARFSDAVRASVARLLDAPTEEAPPKRPARQARSMEKPKKPRKGQSATQLSIALEGDQL